MRLLKRAEDKLHFHCLARERQLLLELLSLYPLVPVGHQELTRAGDRPEDQALLDTALAEHAAENAAQIRRLLQSPEQFRPLATGLLFIISAEELEGLLQALNDIRVGSWLVLGGPDLEGEMPAVQQDNVRYFWAMDLAGNFQMMFLRALTDDPATPPEH